MGAGIGGGQARQVSQLRLMHIDGRDQQVHIAGPSCENLIINDGLVLGLLQLPPACRTSVGLLALPLRITSAEGSNKLTILPSLRLSP